MNHIHDSGPIRYNRPEKLLLPRDTAAVASSHNVSLTRVGGEAGDAGANGPTALPAV